VRVGKNAHPHNVKLLKVTVLYKPLEGSVSVVLEKENGIWG
jgi:hypothetical protein